MYFKTNEKIITISNADLSWALASPMQYAPISIFPRRRGGGALGMYSSGIRLPTNSNPGHLLDNSSGISKLNYITNLMAHPRAFRPHIFTLQGGEFNPSFFENGLIPHGYPVAPPLEETMTGALLV